MVIIATLLVQFNVFFSYLEVSEDSLYYYVCTTVLGGKGQIERDCFQGFFSRESRAAGAPLCRTVVH